MTVAEGGVVGEKVWVGAGVEVGFPAGTVSVGKGVAEGGRAVGGLGVAEGGWEAGG